MKGPARVAPAFMRLLPLLLYLATIALAVPDCRCGYRARNPSDKAEEWVFTDALETDFTEVHDLLGNVHWVGQEFNVSAQDGRGNFGKSFRLGNIETRPSFGGSTTENINEAGLTLRVSSVVENNAILSAELDSSRLDLLWGSYRAAMKLPKVPGTCAAFFWYFNDTQEIDMEFLSAEFDSVNNVYPLSLVVQSRQSKMAGYDAAKTGTYRQVNLTFDPTADFHEYRFDYLPGKVAFYADSQMLAVMNGDEMPTAGGHLILQHWSNGNPLWSGGPPKSDAFMIVRYVKAYFNSSTLDHSREQREICNNAERNREDACLIPDGTAADAVSGGTFCLNTTGGTILETEGSEDSRGNGGNGRVVPSWTGGIVPSVLVLAMILMLIEE